PLPFARACIANSDPWAGDAASHSAQPNRRTGSGSHGQPEHSPTPTATRLADPHQDSCTAPELPQSAASHFALQRTSRNPLRRHANTRDSLKRPSDSRELFVAAKLSSSRNSHARTPRPSTP